MAQVELQVDRSSPVPLYYQIAQQLEGAIRSGELKPGERLENEVDLADRFGLSRPTVRQAIQELVRKGMLVRKRGVGTQVVQGLRGSEFTRPVALSSLYDDLARTGRRPQTWLPTQIASYTSEELATHGLYELLRRSGVHIRIATQRIGARAATPREAKLLHDRKGAPLLTMERTAYDDSGRAVEFGSHAYRAQTYSFEVTLVER
jgi:DNA-binding GntR family transcriptional regulator